MSQIKQQGKKWVQLRKENLNYNWDSDNNIWMAYFQGYDLLAHKVFFQILNFGYVMTCLKHPRLGIQVPNVGDDNQRCCFFNLNQ